MPRLPLTLALSAISFCLTVLPLSAQDDTIGSITFMQGGVSIIRDGAALASSAVKIGTKLENNDQIRTDSSGQAEIALNASSGFPATIKIRPSTTVNLDLSSSGDSPSANAELLAGSLALKVGRLTGANRLYVHTEGAVAGVRGTEFEIETGPEGELILNTTEGQVDLEDDTGMVYESTPGNVVEMDRQRQIQRRMIPEAERAAYVERWRNERQTDFRGRADQALLTTLDELFKTLREFATAMDALDQHQAVFQRLQAARSARPGPNPAAPAPAPAITPADKAAIQAEILKVRDLAIKIDRLQERVQTAARLLGPEQMANLRLRDGKLVKDVLLNLKQVRAGVEARLAKVQGLVKLWAQQNGGALPRQPRPGQPGGPARPGVPAGQAPGTPDRPARSPAPAARPPR